MHTAQYKYTMCRVETDLNRLEPWLCPSSQSNARSDMLYSITLIKISTKLYKSKICRYTSFDKQDLEARKTESKVSPYFIMKIGMFPHSSEFFTVLRWETSTTWVRGHSWPLLGSWAKSKDWIPNPECSTLTSYLQKELLVYFNCPGSIDPLTSHNIPTEASPYAISPYAKCRNQISRS